MQRSASSAHSTRVLASEQNVPLPFSHPVGRGAQAQAAVGAEPVHTLRPPQGASVPQVRQPSTDTQVCTP
jgi:hypothetical protein